MSTMSDPSDTRTAAEVRARTSDTFAERLASIKETKPSFMTTEFWLTIIGVAALIVLYNYTDNPSLDLWRTCLLCSGRLIAAGDQALWSSKSSPIARSNASRSTMSAPSLPVRT